MYEGCTYKTSLLKQKKLHQYDGQKVLVLPIFKKLIKEKFDLFPSSSRCWVAALRRRFASCVVSILK